MSTTDPLSYTVVADDGRGESPSTQELRQALEKGSDEVKLETLRTIVVATLNGNPQVSRRADHHVRECWGAGAVEKRGDEGESRRKRAHL